MLTSASSAIYSAKVAHIAQIPRGRSMKRLKVSSFFAAVVSVLLVGGLCSIASSTASSAAGSKSEWVIATQGTLSGSEAPAYSGCAASEEAWVKTVNAAGGIN